MFSHVIEHLYKQGGSDWPLVEKHCTEIVALFPWHVGAAIESRHARTRNSKYRSGASIQACQRTGSHRCEIPGWSDPKPISRPSPASFTRENVCCSASLKRELYRGQTRPGRFKPPQDYSVPNRPASGDDRWSHFERDSAYRTKNSNLLWLVAGMAIASVPVAQAAQSTPKDRKAQTEKIIKNQRSFQQPRSMAEADATQVKMVDGTVKSAVASVATRVRPLASSGKSSRSSRRTCGAACWSATCRCMSARSSIRSTPMCSARPARVSSSAISPTRPCRTPGTAQRWRKRAPAST